MAMWGRNRGSHCPRGSQQLTLTKGMFLSIQWSWKHRSIQPWGIQPPYPCSLLTFGLHICHVRYSVSIFVTFRKCWIGFHWSQYPPFSDVATSIVGRGTKGQSVLSLNAVWVHCTAASRRVDVVSVEYYLLRHILFGCSVIFLVMMNKWTIDLVKKKNKTQNFVDVQVSCWNLDFWRMGNGETRNVTFFPSFLNPYCSFSFCLLCFLLSLGLGSTSHHSLGFLLVPGAARRNQDSPECQFSRFTIWLFSRVSLWWMAQRSSSYSDY